MDEFEQQIWDEFRKHEIYVKGKKGLRSEIISQIASLVQAHRKRGAAGRQVFRQIAGEWYAGARQRGYFKNDKGKEDRFNHSFTSFAQYLDEFYEIGVMRASPWVRFVRWFRKVRYDIRKFFKKKRVNT